MVLKNNKPVRWTYDIEEDLNVKPGETHKYFKGLGGWTPELLEYVIEKDGLEKMIEVYNFDSKEIIDDFMATDKADKRKEYIQNKTFSIASL